MSTVSFSKTPTAPLATAFAKSVAFACSGYTGSSTLTNFPIAVRLADGSPAGFRYADMSNSSNGSELRFADNVGRSLPYEVECWDTNGASLVWVRIPAVAKGTTFAMHYGGAPVAKIQPRRIWSDYVGVWHMAEEGGVSRIHRRMESTHGRLALPHPSRLRQMASSAGHASIPPTAGLIWASPC